MRRVGCFVLLLLLPGCTGMGDFLSNTFSSGNPNGPIGDSENMRLVRGQAASVEPLGPEPGNIWPGPIGPMPTLQDFEKNGFQPTPNGQPYAPDHREPTPQGSSTPPPTSVPAPPPLPQTVPPLVTAPPPQRNLTGQPVQTPSTSGVISSGTTGYQTLTTPQGPAVVVPNGNGTSTVIHSDGRVETIPTPGK